MACHAVVKESGVAEHARVCKVYNQDRSKVRIPSTFIHSIVSWNFIPLLYGKGVKPRKESAFFDKK